jgi:hypothetical protein
MTPNCISYEKLLGALNEISQSPKVDPYVRRYAREAIDGLKDHPKAMELLKEGLSNASCSDIAQVVQSLGAGVRDVAIASNSMELRYDLSHAFNQISKAANKFGNAADNLGQTSRELGIAARTTTETIGYAGREIGSVYGRFDKGIKDGAYVSAFLIPILLVAAGAFYGRRLLQRFTRNSN